MLEALKERYEVLAELGEGGFGRVFSVRDRSNGALLAVKTISRPDPLRLSLLKQEARVVGGIVHPNLLTLHGLEQAGDELFLMMELVNGVRLDSYIAYGRQLFTETKDINADTAAVPQHLVSLTMAPEVFESIEALPDELLSDELPPAESLLWKFSTLAVDLDEAADSDGDGGELATGWAPDEARLRESMTQVATALTALHSIGRVHRDLKPDNILVERDGRVVLLDFGLAFMVDEQNHLGKAVGTPGFMAPEQIRGDRCTVATDWYSFGAVLHLLLHGAPPYAADAGALARIARGEPLATPPASPVGLEDLANLAARLLRPEPEERPDGPEVLAVLQIGGGGESQAGMATTRRVAALRDWASRTGPVLVGRDEELATLERAWDQVLAGQPAMVAVHGPSGIGTTTVLDAFCAGRADCLVMQGRCYQHESVPFAGWDALVDQLAGELDTLPPWTLEGVAPRELQCLLRVFPMLAGVKAIVSRVDGVEPPADPVELRNAAFDGLFAILAALASDRRTVVRLDDLHWADPSSAAMALRLFETLPNQPLLVMLSWHDEQEAAADLRRLTETERCEDLVMAPLSLEDSRELADRLLVGRCAARDEVAERIAAQSGGLPLFISELALAAAQEIDAPDDLDSLIRRRADLLPPEARSLLQVVVMAGRPVALATAAELADCASPALAARVLVAESLVRSIGPRGRGSLECFNSRVGAALRAGQDPAEVRTVLLALAEATAADRDPEAKGRYLLAAGEERLAAPLLLAAAERARDALAFERAEDLLALAGPGLTDATERRRCAWARAEALAAIGRGPAAAEQYLAAADAGDPGQLQECQRLATEQLVRAGHFVAAHNLLGQVVTRAGMQMPEGNLKTVLGLLFQRLLVSLRGLRFAPRDEAELPASLLRRIDTAWFVSQGLALFAPVSAAFVQARNLRRALRAGEPGRIAHALAVEAGFRSTMGGRGLRQAEELLTRSMQATPELAPPRLRAIQLLARSILAFQTGQWGACRAFAEQTADLVRTRCRGAGWELGTALIYQLTTLSLQGEHARVARLLPRAIRGAADRGDVHTELHLRLSQPLPLACVRDRPGEGREQVLEAWSRWGGLEWGLLELYAGRQLIELALYERDYDRARRRSDELWTALRRSPTKYVKVTTMFAHASRLRVALLGRAEQVPGADQYLKRDLRALTRSGMGWARAEVVAARAQLELLAGVDAAGQLADAAVLFADAGQRAHAEAARVASTGQPCAEVDGLSTDWLREQGAVAPARLARMMLPAVR